ncbi:fumarate hydratase [Mucilaginibacter sp.]|uniref:fumarate hydratase n=1 Tax=Mucilaginibacter sp. TaxID=1882438 RepID=UPI0028464B16|nr:fumarate hydratase [Mucilaginibacter sp.]MDR3696931.1 fumarate hydratase [Mucilaginibacter sp.]
MQKLFSFRLLPFVFLLLAFGPGCSFNPNVQKPGEGYLQGEWRQDSVTNQKQLITYSLYHLKFSCDSFYMEIHSFSKINTGVDTCMNVGHWVEYTRGTYVQSNDTLHLTGQFCNADYSIKDDKGCFRSGDYEEFFKVSKQTDSLFTFASTTNVIPLKAHLIKRLSCHPKPI